MGANIHFWRNAIPILAFVVARITHAVKLYDHKKTLFSPNSLRLPLIIDQRPNVNIIIKIKLSKAAAAVNMLLMSKIKGRNI